MIWRAYVSVRTVFPRLCSHLCMCRYTILAKSQNCSPRVRSARAVSEVTPKNRVTGHVSSGMAIVEHAWPPGIAWQMHFAGNLETEASRLCKYMCRRHAGAIPEYDGGRPPACVQALSQSATVAVRLPLLPAPDQPNSFPHASSPAYPSRL